VSSAEFVNENKRILVDNKKNGLFFCQFVDIFFKFIVD